MTNKKKPAKKPKNLSKNAIKPKIIKEKALSQKDKKNLNNICNFPEIWKDRLAYYVGMLDKEGAKFTVGKFAASIGISFSNTRNYIRKDSIAQYRKQLAELSLVDKEEDDEDLIDFMAEVDAARPKASKNKKNQVAIYCQTFHEDGELAKDYRKALKTGLSVTDEIVLIRTMLMRATRLMDLQDRRLADFDNKSDVIAYDKIDDSRSESPELEGLNIETAALKESNIVSGDTFSSYVKDTNPEKGGIKTTYEIRDYNKIIKSLTTQLGNLIEIQYKIEYEHTLTATERRDVMRRVLDKVARGELTAFNAGIVLVSSGVDNIPVPLEIRIREEARNAEPERDVTPAINREDIIAVENMIKTSKQEERIEFLEKREKEIADLIKEQDEE